MDLVFSSRSFATSMANRARCILLRPKFVAVISGEFLIRSRGDGMYCFAPLRCCAVKMWNCSMASSGDSAVHSARRSTGMGDLACHCSMISAGSLSIQRSSFQM